MTPGARPAAHSRTLRLLIVLTRAPLTPPRLQEHALDGARAGAGGAAKELGGLRAPAGHRLLVQRPPQAHADWSILHLMSAGVACSVRGVSRCRQAWAVLRQNMVAAH